MPLGPEKQASILQHLGEDVSKLPEIRDRCLAIESTSEALVVVIERLLEELEAMRLERDDAASGLVRADVLEWSDHRSCGLRRQYDTKRYELAKLIGYPLEITIVNF